MSLMEEPVNRSNEEFTFLNSSLSSLDNTDVTLSLPAGGREDEGTTWTGSSAHTSQGQKHGEDVSQWQCEFRGHIRALRLWLNSMEKRLPPPAGGDFFEPLGGKRGWVTGLLCAYSLTARLEKSLALEALCTHDRTH